jgi:hypothetical protein
MTDETPSDTAHPEGEMRALLRALSVLDDAASIWLPEENDTARRLARMAAHELRQAFFPPPSRPQGEEGWLPIVLAPTDGQWRYVRLPDGSETVASFDGDALGPRARRWRTRAFAYHNPSRPSGEKRGGVEQFTQPYDTFVIGDLPDGVYPTHFRPNDTVYGTAETQAQRAISNQGKPSS